MLCLCMSSNDAECVYEQRCCPLRSHKQLVSRLLLWELRPGAADSMALASQGVEMKRRMLQFVVRHGCGTVPSRRVQVRKPA